MANEYRLVNGFITEVLDKATSDTSATWDDFYNTLSEDAKSGYADLVDWIYSSEDLENAEKYIDVDDVMELIVEFDVTDPEELIRRVQDSLIEKLEIIAMNAEHRAYLAECEIADYAYDSMRDALVFDED